MVMNILFPFFLFLEAVPYGEDPGRGSGEQHHGVPAQHPLTDRRLARPVPPPVPPQPRERKGQNAKVRYHTVFEEPNANLSFIFISMLWALFVFIQEFNSSSYVTTNKFLIYKVKNVIKA